MENIATNARIRQWRILNKPYAGLHGSWAFRHPKSFYPMAGIGMTQILYKDFVYKILESKTVPNNAQIKRLPWALGHCHLLQSKCNALTNGPSLKQPLMVTNGNIKPQSAKDQPHSNEENRNTTHKTKTTKTQTNSTKKKEVSHPSILYVLSSGCPNIFVVYSPFCFSHQTAKQAEAKKEINMRSIYDLGFRIICVHICI